MASESKIAAIERCRDLGEALRGGQGRTPEDICDAGNSVWIIGFACAAGFVLAAAVDWAANYFLFSG